MRQEKILIIDSDISLMEVVKTRLEAEDYLVVCAKSAKEAFESLAGTWIDAIIVDIKLKGKLKGLELIQKLRRKRAYSLIPIIVQTTKINMKQTAILSGVEAFLLKPYNIDTMVDEVKDILTPKFLLMGDKSQFLKSAAKKMEALDIRADKTHTLSKYYYSILTYRYRGIALMYDGKPNLTDRMMQVVRVSSKNENTPIMLLTKKTKARGKKGIKEKEQIEIVKERCQYIGMCEVVEGCSSASKFIETAEKYLG